VLATGYNMVDVEAATRRGVLVTNVPTYGTLSVAQMVFAHLLHLVHDVGGYAEGVRRGRWSASKDFCYWDSPLHELHGRTMGIVGYGRIGRATGAIAAAFGMRVLACDPSRAEEEAAAADWVSLEELLRRSDVISLHCPLTPETRGMIRSKQLGLMKPSAFLINTSRGALVDERALADALNSGALAGAGLDVLAQEPPEATNPLLRARNCQITPHLAWATREARERLLREVAGNLAAWMHGTPRNVVNHPLQSGRARSRA
jgi:glycerate dehydrogenase